MQPMGSQRPGHEWVSELNWIGVFNLGFILFGTPWVSWTWVASSFSILWKFSTIISSSIFSSPFFLSFFFFFFLAHLRFKCFSLWYCSRSLWGCPHFFLFFFLFFHSFSFISTFTFLLTYPFFCLSYSAVDPSKMFLISVITLFIMDWLFFISSRS